MNDKEKYELIYDNAVKFHGHACPGLLSGLLMSIYALENFNVDRSIDEELVTITEGTSCMVDGFQSVLGTTLGKGNLIMKDYGKNSATFLNRKTGKGIRSSFNFLKMRDKLQLEDMREKLRTIPIEERGEYIKKLYFKLLDFPLDDLLNVEEVNMKLPEEAQIHETLICEKCGEGVMSSRIKKVNGKNLCISCAEGKYWTES